jgi:chromosome segregation ATPase
MAVTKEQVFEAADRLAAEGKKPTLENVRGITGGSYSTISPALNEWKARQAAGSAPLREPVPQSVQDRLAEVGQEVWAAALDLANARLETEREALQAAREEMQAERAEALETADKLAEKVEKLTAELSQTRASAQAQALDLAAAQARAAETRADLELARAEAAAAREALAAAREEAATLRGRLEALEPLLSRLTAVDQKE